MFLSFSPLWWLSEDPEALYSGDQFVIDDTMIVAPVLTEGATSRTVFLPDGIWEYELTHNIYTGPIKLTIEVSKFESEKKFCKKEVLLVTIFCHPFFFQAPLFHHAPPYFTFVG